MNKNDRYHHEIYSQSWQLLKRLAVDKTQISDDSEGIIQITLKSKLY